MRILLGNPGPCGGQLCKDFTRVIDLIALPGDNMSVTIVVKKENGESASRTWNWIEPEPVVGL